MKGYSKKASLPPACSPPRPSRWATSGRQRSAPWRGLGCRTSERPWRLCRPSWRRRASPPSRTPCSADSSASSRCGLHGPTWCDRRATAESAKSTDPRVGAPGGGPEVRGHRGPLQQRHPHRELRARGRPRQAQGQEAGGAAPKRPRHRGHRRRQDLEVLHTQHPADERGLLRHRLEGHAAAAARQRAGGERLRDQLHEPGAHVCLRRREPLLAHPRRGGDHRVRRSASSPTPPATRTTWATSSGSRPSGCSTPPSSAT